MISNRTMYLHCDPDSGGLWRSDGANDSPADWGMPVGEFLSKIDLTTRGVRVLGCRSNAALIVDLSGLLQEGALRGLELATPGHVNAGELRNPPRAIWRAMALELPASAGGWHRFHELEVWQYRLMLATGSSGGGLLNTAVRSQLLVSHPCGPLALFFGGKALAARLADLVVDVVDPRWFVGQVDVDDDSGLMQYLGVTERTLERVLCGSRSRSTLEARCHNVLYLASLVDDARLGFSAGGPGETLVDTLQRLVRLICTFWMQRLVVQPLFVAADYFDADGVVKFDKFIGSLLLATG